MKITPGAPKPYPPPCLPRRAYVGSVTYPCFVCLRNFYGYSRTPLEYPGSLPDSSVEYLKGAPPKNRQRSINAPHRCIYVVPPPHPGGHVEASQRPKTPRRRLKTPPNGPQMPQEASKTPSDGSKTPQEAFKRPPRPSKIDFSSQHRPLNPQKTFKIYWNDTSSEPSH